MGGSLYYLLASQCVSTGNKWETEDGDDYVGMEGGGGVDRTKEYLVRVRSVPLWCKRLRGGEAEEKEGSRGFVVTSATAREWEKILGLSVQLKFERWIELECKLVSRYGGRSDTVRRGPADAVLNYSYRIAC
jgi:hypothetical protein